MALGRWFTALLWMTTIVLVCHTCVVIGNLRCRSCDQVGGLGKCVASVTCTEHQVCFMEKYMTNQMQVTYTGGCRESTVCPDFASVIPVGRRRRNVPTVANLTCSKCCKGSNYCNLKLCGDTVNNVPPKIVTQSAEDETYVRIGQSLTLPCLANGTPAPVYFWKYNGHLLDTSNVTESVMQTKGEGTLVFTRFSETREGLYQCFAENRFGTSMSKVFKIRAAKFSQPPYTPPTVTSAWLGTPLTLPCDIPRSSPAAGIQWVLSGSNDTWQDVLPSPRIITDHEGRLMFLNVRPEDDVSGQTYKCLTSNSVTGEHHFGSAKTIRVFGATEQRMPVMEYWTSPSGTIILKSSTLKLTCLFSGNPTASVYWTTSNGSGIENTRASFPDFGNTLQITDIDYSDAGIYICVGINSETPAAQTKWFDVLVEAAPSWKVKPTDVYGHVDGSATFICQAEGTPAPFYQWFINGTPLHESKDPRVRDGRLLQPTIDNITLVHLTTGDHMNIQCNATNRHGYLLADVILNVDP